MFAQKVSNQPAHPRSLTSFRCPHEETLHPWQSKRAPSDDSDQTANAQSDQNLHWADMSDGTFPSITAHFFYIFDS